MPTDLGVLPCATVRRGTAGVFRPAVPRFASTVQGVKRIITLPLVVLSAAALSAPSPAAPEDLPLGKKYFVVAKGELRTNGGENSRNNRVWLGTYTFDSAGHRVTAALHHWNQDKVSATREQRPFGNRDKTGRTPTKDCVGPPPGAPPGSGLSVRQCEVYTTKGFTKPPQQTLAGTYNITSAADGGQQKLSITWTDLAHAPGHRREESWTLSRFQGDDKLAELNATVLHSRPGQPAKTYAAFTGGFGYGSNTPTDVRVRLGRTRSVTGLSYQGWTWNQNVIKRETSGFTLDQFRTCDGGGCLTHTARSSGHNGACAPEKCPAGSKGDTSIQYYIAQVGAADRRDTEWHWCTCLRQAEPCYSGGSHVQPLLQVLDDDGVFRGWIGVEASFYNRKPNLGSSRHDLLAVLSRMPAPAKAS